VHHDREVPVMGVNTRERLVEVATQLFYNDGFRHVGLDQILTQVGITKTAFYKHFPSVDDLIVEVLRKQSVWLQSHFMEIVRQHGGPTAMGQLSALFDAVEQILQQEGFHGCIFVSAAMEFPSPHDPAHRAALQNRLAIERLVHDIAERAGALQPQVLAEQLCLIMEGTYAARQVTGRPETIETARQIAHEIIRSHFAATCA
jgi:AcrR family transcriptional regulator